MLQRSAKRAQSGVICSLASNLKQIKQTFLTYKTKMKLRYILFVIIIIYFACTTPAGMQQTWSNPAPGNNYRFEKILFVALLKDAYTRKVAEDKLVDKVRPRGIASYSYLPYFNTVNNNDTGLVANRLRQDGFDGIVIMRLINITTGTILKPGEVPPYYNSWYGYYSSTFPLYNVPGTTQVNDIYNVETNIYSLNEDKLLWSGLTTAVTINDKPKMIDGIIAAVKQKMKDEGFIQ